MTPKDVHSGTHRRRPRAPRSNSRQPAGERAKRESNPEAVGHCSNRQATCHILVNLSITRMICPNILLNEIKPTYFNSQALKALIILAH